ncbi:hypothetical protein Pelo_19472 [Pelomyxa schiedti]|nr:hypothetical protein Pelo_19472 [Pelomyxa schiedti]
MQMQQQLEILLAAPPEELTSALETMQAQKCEAEHAAQQKQLAVNQAEQARDHALAQCHAAMRRESQLLSEIKKLQTDLAKETQKLSTAQKQIENAQAQANEASKLQHELDHVSKELSQTKKLFEQARKELVSRTTEVKRLQDEKTDLTNIIAFKDKTIESLDVNNTELQAQVRHLSDSLSQSEHLATSLRSACTSHAEKVENSTGNGEEHQPPGAATSPGFGHPNDRNIGQPH